MRALWIVHSESAPRSVEHPEYHPAMTGHGPDVVVSEARIEMTTAHFDQSGDPVARKLAAFPRFVERTDLSRFLVRYEIFKEILGVQGSVIECGVMDGAGMFTFAHISVLLEPLNHRRKIIGFDTFAGFPDVSGVDRAGGSKHLVEGGYRGASYTDLMRSIEHFDSDRPLAELSKIELVEGDFLETGQQFLDRNPHLIVALLYLDFDLLEPTAEAIRVFVPRMPAGAVIAFDESNVKEAPGETLAMVETIGIRNLRLRRSSVGSIAWATLT
jgi:hypothetical protein